MNDEQLRLIDEITVIDLHRSHTLEALRIRSDDEILDVSAINLGQLGSKEKEVEERGGPTITEALTEGALNATESATEQGRVLDFEVHELLKRVSRRFHAYEDTLLYLISLSSLLATHTIKKTTLVDICGGNAFVAINCLLAGISDVWVLELFTEAALKLREQLSQKDEWTSKSFERWRGTDNRIQKFDVLGSEQKTITNLICQESKGKYLIVAANPPWEPMNAVLVKMLRHAIFKGYIEASDRGISDEGAYIQGLSDHDTLALREFLDLCQKEGLTAKTLPMICGGESGLEYLGPIFEMAQQLEACFVCLNFSSLSDTLDFEDLCQSYGLVVLNMRVLRTYTYHYDRSKIAQEHIKGIENNVYHSDETGIINQYIIINVVLEFVEGKDNKEVDALWEQFRNVLRIYSHNQDGYAFRRALKKRQLANFCKVFDLDNENKRRILGHHKLNTS